MTQAGVVVHGWAEREKEREKERGGRYSEEGQREIGGEENERKVI